MAHPVEVILLLNFAHVPHDFFLLLETRKNFQLTESPEQASFTPSDHPAHSICGVTLNFTFCVL